MKKFIVRAICALALVVSATSCSIFVSDVSTPEINFGWAEDDGPEAINGYTCVGSMWIYVDAFQTTFEPISDYHSWTTAGGSCYTKSMESKEVDKYVKNYADKAIKLAQTNCTSEGYNLPVGETFRVVYSYGASKKKTKVLNYEVK